VRTALRVLLVVGLTALPATLPAAEPARAPLLSFQPMDPVVQKKLDEASARIEALSRALRAAIGDAEEYARLRAEHDAAVLTYEALSRTAYP
jgi:hypothetical protein